MNVRPARFFAAYDGALRELHKEPPIAALERGPVWIVNVFHGYREQVVAHASVARAGDECVLVLYENDRLVAVVHTSDICGYERVTIVDAEVKTRHGSWSDLGLGMGDELTLVHANTGDFH